MNKLSKIPKVRISFRNKVDPKDRVTIKSSETAYEVLYHAWNKGNLDHVEEFKILLLNQANHVLGVSEISKGGIAGTVLDVKVIFQTALLCTSNSIILAHNHPSGNMAPSESDLRVTQKIKQAGELLDIKVLDHLIITSWDYTSLADMGKM